jgi:hypothetical protein
MPVRKSLYQHHNICDENAPPKLLLVTSSQLCLAKTRDDLEASITCIRLIKEKTSFHPNIENAIDELKDSILKLRADSVECIRCIEKDLKNSVHYHNQEHHTHVAIDQRYLSEIWRVSYTFGIELQSECIKFITQDRAEQFALGLANFAIMWCEYIVDKTERGKGRTGRCFLLESK